MIKSLNDLRTVAVKHILRREPGAYLLRHALCKPWIASEHLNEVAWTDYRRLFFNIPKIRAQLDRWPGQLDPGDHTTAFLGLAGHEILHNLWLHRARSKDKHRGRWRAACEYAINYELGKIFGPDWIAHLNGMYPDKNLLRALQNHDLEPTTDGFYTLFSTLPDIKVVQVALQGASDCNHCDRPLIPQPGEDDEAPTKDALIKVLNQLPESPEKADIRKFVADYHVPAQPVPWEQLLIGGIEDAVQQEQTWAKPSRRDDNLPGWRHEKLLSFVWILDVSPSIDDEMKASFMNTLQAGINLYHDATHRVIFFAEGIIQDLQISSGTQLSQMQIPCGNGTCLGEVWEVLERDLPEYALVLTDLELNAVPKPSYTKIVWGIVGEHRYFDPDYGTKIELK